jgi:transcriptional regulator with GAF, ATPase, and Fis domain
MGSNKRGDNSVESRAEQIWPDCYAKLCHLKLDVTDVMDTNVFTVSPEVSVAFAGQLMSNNNVSCIVVAEGRRPVGIVSESDFLKDIKTGADCSEMRVEQIMSAPVESISPDVCACEAGKVMYEKGIKLLVVLYNGQTVGLITQADLVRASASYGIWGQVGEIMTRDVAVTQGSVTIRQAGVVMNERNISSMVVVEDDKVVGIITESDILKKVVAQQKDPDVVKVEEIMFFPVVRVPSSCSIFRALRIMESKGIRRVVVMDDDRLVGILTQTDIFRTVKNRLHGDITELVTLRQRLKTEQSFAGIVGHDPKMLELFETVKEVAEVGVPVLIQGESGTGKELVAAAIHNEGPSANKPFVPVNCGALPEGVLESELFGHVKGAFTGATDDRKGRFELADGGTIFLDEVGDIPASMQVKLLRVLQEGTFEPVGAEKSIKVSVRVISATNKNLAEEVSAGRFREDLFYRLCVVPIYLPSLRERPNDIPLLADHLLKKAAEQSGREQVELSAEAKELMLNYDWPGNVRELENALQYALLKCRGELITEKHFPAKMLTRHIRQSVAKTRRRRHKLDAASVARALEESGGNKVEAAALLGVSRATLYRFLEDSEKTAMAGVESA